jgi:hypothetical protein
MDIEVLKAAQHAIHAESGGLALLILKLGAISEWVTRDMP